MGSKNSEKSSEVVQAYLCYLQEMSRKISLRTGMENTLYKKAKRSYHYYKPFEDIDINSSYLRRVNDYLKKESDRQLFLGNGLIVGSFKKKQAKKYITAPLIYFLVNIDLDENGRSWTYNIERDSVSLNYDLITQILEQDNNEDNEGIEFQSAGVDANKLEILEDIENSLEEMSKNEYDQLMTDELAIQTFEQISKKVPEFSQVNFSTEEFTLEKIGNLGTRTEVDLTFYKHRFFYVAGLPGQLSTYTALRKLILEVS
ncbi:MAG: hypothetical protein ACO349_07100 [Flavobacteriaceae bacterium]